MTVRICRMLALVGLIVVPWRGSHAAPFLSGQTVLDLEHDLWRVRLVRGTTEYAVAPGVIAKTVYQPKKKDAWRGKQSMEEGDYTVATAPDYLLPETTSADWMQPDFDDGQWLRASGTQDPGDESGRLILVRGWFEVSDPALCVGLALTANYRGGIVVYLNGEEIARQDMLPGGAGLEACAQPYPEAVHLRPDGRVLTSEEVLKKPEWIRRLEALPLPPAKLRRGPNLLAVALHRAPLDRVCLLRPNGRNRLISADSGGPAGWATVGLSALTLAVPDAAATVPRAAAMRRPGWKVWQQNPFQPCFENDPGEPWATPRRVRLYAPRGGSATGLLVAAAPSAMRGLTARSNDLKGPATLPAGQCSVRFMLPDGGAQSPRRLPGETAFSFDALAETAPAAVATNMTTGLALQPLWLQVAVPAATPAGDYTGTLTLAADGEKPVSIQLELRVAAWTMPAAEACATHMDIFQSPDSVAMQYEVPMWSEAHLKLLERTFGLLAPLGTKTLYITAVRRTHLGNEHAMVQWVRGKDGQLEPDLGVVERYLDVAGRQLGRIPSVILYCWEPPYSMGHAGNPNSPGRRHDRPILLTLKSAASDKLRAITGPEWGTPESVELWGKLTLAMQKTLARRGMPDALLFGLMGDHRPTKAAMDEIANAAPATPWAVHSHFYCLEHNGYKVGLCAAVWGIGCIPSLPEHGESGYGWRSPFRLTLNSRYDLRLQSPPGTYLALPEKWLGAKAGGRGVNDHPLNGAKGMGRMGADFWPVLKDQRGVVRERLCGRYPEAAWGQLSLGNCVTALLAPGPTGPLATARSEALRECVQAMEARVAIERVLLDTERAAALRAELADRCRRVIDNRRRAAWHGGEFLAGADWSSRTALLYDLAAEVAAVGQAGQGGKP